MVACRFNRFKYIFSIPRSILIGFMRNIKSYEPTEALLFTGRRVYGLAGLVLV